MEYFDNTPMEYLLILIIQMFAVAGGTFEGHSMSSETT